MNPDKTKTSKSEKTRENIYHVALDLFTSKGFDATTMREIAEAGNMAIGSTYYYFSSKEAIVMEFYIRTQQELMNRVRQEADAKKQLRERLQILMKIHFELFAPCKKFVAVLARFAADATHPLSPFSPATAPVRERSIQLINELVEGADIKIADDLRPHLAELLWLYHMAMLFFWIHDQSPQAGKTGILLEKSLDVVIKLLKISGFPLVKSVRHAIIDLMQLIGQNVQPQIVEKVTAIPEVNESGEDLSAE